ncbi:hypothetical protein SDRG_16072 [Saprolegnia diclina VS20]|uniref:Uncharacterized protein n=1 Tax=Saprolegnia diclina (strain VS20) TaxID=1156394 RepID=T0R276_SAPDV|nr:hypothetical protein SDRG_16072 [Saprolegnia diclina VS20]EQC26123.1 hypothetical protein SDRG_16072 [Saprolegnia diclina VS20]|eukprot:XP_008620490.1 hypothetical protein SDRG_16072 [Saprolegnia diclina VS20]
MAACRRSSTRCAALLRSEAHYRATTPHYPYDEHLRAELNMADAAFGKRLFRQALGSDPAAALRYLNQFVNSDGRYNLTFKDLNAIYGKYHIKSSVLYSVLNGRILAYVSLASLCGSVITKTRVLPPSRATAGATSRMQASRRDTSRASTPEMSNAAAPLVVLDAQAHDAVALTMLDNVASLPASSQLRHAYINVA